MSFIVIGAESWCHHYELETKQQHFQWKHHGSPLPKEIKKVPTAGRVLLGFFIDYKGPLFVTFLECGQTVNTHHYCATLDQLRKAIKNRWPGLLMKGLIILHGSAQLHSASVTLP
jgi:hypothetical protein